VKESVKQLPKVDVYMKEMFHVW
jgi:hypothetical protein